MTQRKKKARLYEPQSKEERAPFQWEPTRDPVIIQTVFDYRIINSTQLAKVVRHRLPEFTINKYQRIKTSETRVKRRFRPLIDQHYIKRPKEQGSVLYEQWQPTMLMLQYEGARYLVDELGYDKIVAKRVQKPVSSQNIPHEIGIADVRVCLEVGLPLFGYELVEWIRPGDKIKRRFNHIEDGEQQSHLINSDGFARVCDSGRTAEWCFFNEYDRGHVDKRRMKARYRAYHLFKELGLHKKAPFNVAAKSFRVLTTYEEDEPFGESKRRVDHVEELKQCVRDVVPKGSWRNFWFTRTYRLKKGKTFDVDPNAIGKLIFETPRDQVAMRLLSQ